LSRRSAAGARSASCARTTPTPPRRSGAWKSAATAAPCSASGGGGNAAKASFTGRRGGSPSDPLTLRSPPSSQLVVVLVGDAADGVHEIRELLIVEALEPAQRAQIDHVAIDGERAVGGAEEVPLEQEPEQVLAARRRDGQHW